MHIFVVMIEMYMLCVSSDISHHILYVVLYHVGLFSLLEFEINYLSIYHDNNYMPDCVSLA